MGKNIRGGSFDTSGTSSLNLNNEATGSGIGESGTSSQMPIGATASNVNYGISEPRGKSKETTPSGSLEYNIITNVAPCFGVENIAEHFVDLIGKLDCEDDKMIGIFGSWGRGKTYFYSKVKEEIIRQNNEENKVKGIIKRLKVSLEIFFKYIWKYIQIIYKFLISIFKPKVNEDKKIKIKYDFVEFNAWKYQETPAIWAYLFETFFKAYGGWRKRIFYKLWRNIFLFLIVIVLFVAYYIYVYLYIDVITPVEKVKLKYDLFVLSIEVKDILSFSCKYLFPLILLYPFVNKLYNAFSAFTLIKKYTKPTSFNRVLGIQAEIEKELSSLLKFWICSKNTKSRKIILFIDDIDRCSEVKMVSIIDSLRTVLENPIIRERLIILCAIDDLKLKKAIAHKYKEVYTKESDEEKNKLDKIVNEQIDKIFISGIKIPSAKLEDNMDFIDKLMKEDKQKNINRSNQSKNTDGNKDEFNSKIKPIFAGIIKSNYPKVTPRQLRIIYYRVLFYNNLIVGKSNVDYTQIIRVIFDKTMSNEPSQILEGDEKSLIEMVVPY